ncbi:MAG: hypothetical protein ACI9L9_000919 [Marivirga sp.]|jgi:hypothetical protein
MIEEKGTSSDSEENEINSEVQKDNQVDDSAKNTEEATLSTEQAASEEEKQAEEPATLVDKVDDSPEDPSKGESSPVEKEAVHEDEENQEEAAQEEDLPDYTDFSKEQLVETIKEVAHQDDFRRGDGILKEIKPLFDAFYETEKREALANFLSEGGEEADFAMNHDDLNDRFNANHQLYKDKRRKYFKDLERQRDDNLKKKEDILNKLRELVAAEETITGLNVIKDIQNEWKSIGQVPGPQARTLWANYNALLDRYYDQRSILFELKELDRKKNLEAKLILCDKAEVLAEEKDVPSAVKQLNDLHEDFKHIGPVPKEKQEALWQRFKAASDSVYEKRKGYLDNLKDIHSENLKKKEVIITKMEPFLSFDSDKIKEWNSKTKDLLAIQKDWETTGQVPKENVKHINKTFWSNFKQFFSNKHEFFKRLDQMREDNLNKKKELVNEALSLADSTEWNKTADKLKKLQNHWREVGPVPEKFRESVYKEFKSACDKFFENKRAGSQEAEKEFGDNLKAKEDIIAQINGLEPGDIEQLEAYEEAFGKLGFVPRNAIQPNKEQFADAVNSFIEKSEAVLSEEQLNKVKLMAQITKIMAGPNAGKKLNQKEHGLRKKISDLNNDIVTWKTNLEFFASSKTADNLKKEFNLKIEEAEKEISLLKKQLRIVISIE